jgi:hypothetical protein
MPRWRCSCWISYHIINWFEHCKCKNVIKGIVSKLTIKFWMCQKCGTMIDWLNIYCFTSRSRIFHLYEDVTIAGEGLQNLGLCSALRAFEQRGIFIVPHLLWHDTSVFRCHPRTAPFICLLQHAWGCREPILTRILTGRGKMKDYNQKMNTSVVEWLQTHWIWVTGQNGMLIPPWHLIPPLIYSAVRIRPFSDLYFL